jgi:hypothetical protein
VIVSSLESTQRIIKAFSQITLLSTMATCSALVAFVLLAFALGDIHQPETEIEIVFSIFIMLIGAFTFCSLIGSFSSILTAADTAALAFHEKMLLLQRFMQGVSLPKTLQRRILQYYDYLWDRHKVEIGLIASIC